ncbi:MAG: methylmalonyl Co-A mutase-associated GTPase MeaB, partial [Hyphomicrobiaceae bacterium]
MMTEANTAQTLAAGIIQRQRRAIANGLSLVEARGLGSGALVSALQDHLGNAAVLGLTGPPGAGKSTLVNALIRALRQKCRRVAVLAIDPSSPISGGAILGDRIRMTAALDDDGVLVRSLGTRGSLGGLTPDAVRMIDILDAAGFDDIILETVGTGQSEIDVAEIADVVTVVAAPGLGDGIQAMKSGLLEMADVIVVNKADQPGAARTREELGAALSRRAEPRANGVLMTSALSGEGVDMLATVIGDLAATHLTQDVSVRRRQV